MQLPFCKHFELLYDLLMEKNDAGSVDLMSLGYQYYKEIYASSPIGIELFDEKGLLFHANPACLRIFGISKVDDILSFCLFDDPNLPLDARQRLQNGETVALSESFSFDVVRQNGLYPTSKSGVIHLDTLITALKEQDGVRGYLAQVQDVTAQKRATEQLEMYQRQLERIVDARTEELEQVNIKLQRELQERRRIAKAEQKQRVLADALRDTVMAITSSLKFSEVVDRILSHIGQVVRYDAVILLTIEDEYVRCINYRGFSKQEADAFIHAEKVTIQEYPNLVIALAHREAVLIADTREYTSWVPHEETNWIASNITVPIIYHDAVIGFINIYSRETGYYSEEHIQPLTLFAQQAAVAIRNARLYESMQHLAIVDELTGLYNRRGLYELGVREVSRVQRFKRPLTAIFFDIDHFKQFNDQYSYAVGDQVLRFLSQNIRSQLREVDLLSRYGGEEFVALLPEIALDEGLEIAERLRAFVEESALEHNRQCLHITVSVGVAPLIARPHFTDLLAGRERELLSDLIERAGEKLHQAKESGRNRVAF